jgi:hypothetical protein
LHDATHFDSNLAQQGTILERTKDDHVAVTDNFYLESIEPTIMTDNSERIRIIQPRNLSRTSSTSSLDSTYLDMLNNLSCEDLDFFLASENSRSDHYILEG